MGAEAAAVATVGGTIVSAIGQSKSSRAQERAERQNAAFLREQERLSRIQLERELREFKEETDSVLADQRSAFAKAGVTFAGTPAALQARTRARATRQTEDIMREGEFRIRLNKLRALRSEEIADGIAEARPFQIAGTILGGGAQTASMFIKK